MYKIISVIKHIRNGVRWIVGGELGAVNFPRNEMLSVNLWAVIFYGHLDSIEWVLFNYNVSIWAVLSIGFKNLV